MKHLVLIACAALIVAACNNQPKPGETADSTAAAAAAPVTSTDNEAPQPYTMPDSATAMKNWMAYSTPGKEHQLLASTTGTWEGEMTSWYEQGKPPMVSKTKSVDKMILGGRYQETTYSGDMMGLAFEGRGLTAYDNARKEFISTWVDNVGTGMVIMRGSWDEATKSINFKGKMVDPSIGDGKERPIREVFRYVDANNTVMEMYGYGPDGKEFKSLEIKLKRVK